MKFADFHTGQVIEAGPYALSEAEVLQFATAYDPQWFHTDPQAAEKGPFGGLIASGWHTCGIAMRLLADKALKGSESFASPGLAYIKWPHPVRPGDNLTVRATVLEARVAARVVRELQGPGREPVNLFTTLSERELEVLRLVARGSSNQEIAEKLVIGESTVKTHVSSILSKLQLEDRTQAAVYAWASGLVRRD